MSRHNATFLDTTTFTPRPSPGVPNPKFAVLGHSIINAPPAAVRDVLLDLPNYRNWNTFVPGAEIKTPAAAQTSTTHMEKGTKFQFRVHMSEKQQTTSNEMCWQAEEAKIPSEQDPNPTTTLRWGFDPSGVPLLSYFLQAEHVNELTDLGDGRTEYVHWEAFGGVLAYVIKWFSGQDLARHFRNWAVDLKTYVEKKEGVRQG